jgi:hypothetical protein
MRFQRIAALVLVLPLAMAACTGGNEPSAKHPALSSATAPSQMLVLDRGSGVVAIDPATGSLMFQRTDMTPLPDWSKAFTASESGGSTDVREIDPSTGASLTSVQVRGSYDVGAVASDGDAVALVPPAPPGEEAWTPVDRSSTTIVVAHPGDPSGTSERYRLHGNYAPEAFSTDGSGLLMLQYLPPVDPASYRVVRLELDKGSVEDLYGRTKGAQPMGPMSGTRLEQVPAPDGTRLYTLYTDQPADYAKEYSEYAKSGHGPVAFVHTLDLQESWAYCVDLPRAFGSGEASAKAIAISSDGSRLYAIDTDQGLIAAMDTQRLKVVGVQHVDLGLGDSGQSVASVSGDGGTLYVGRGSTVVELSLEDMKPVQRWSLGGDTTGLATTSDRLYAATPNAVRILNPATGAQIRSVPVSGVTGIAYLGAATG